MLCSPRYTHWALSDDSGSPLWSPRHALPGRRGYIRSANIMPLMEDQGHDAVCVTETNIPTNRPKTRPLPVPRPGSHSRRWDRAQPRVEQLQQLRATLNSQDSHTASGLARKARLQLLITETVSPSPSSSVVCRVSSVAVAEGVPTAYLPISVQTGTL